MAREVTFKVSHVDNRMVTTKFGPKPVRDVVAEDGTKYQLGFDRVPVAVGDMVTCAVEDGKYGPSVVKGTLRPAGAGATPTTDAPAPQPMAKGGRGGTFPIPNSSGEMAIIRQNALTNAVNLWGHVYSSNVSELEPEHLESILDIAYKFAEFSSGQREVKMAAKIRDRVAKDGGDLTKAIEAAVGSGDYS